MAVELRLARPADLAECAQVEVEALADLARRQGRPPRALDAAQELPLIQHGHGVSPPGWHVAEEDGRIVAFAGAWTRDGLWWLGYLFARPSHQARGLGRSLLERALAPGAGAANAFTMSSKDPSAVALYLRAGLLPRAAVLTFTIDAHLAKETHDAPLRLEPLRRSTLAFERSRFGYARGHDHRFLLQSGALGFELARPDGERGGFLYLQSDGLAGPAGFETADDVAPALDLALAAARDAGADEMVVRAPLANAAAIRWCAGRGARLAGETLLMAREPLSSDLALALVGHPALA